MNETDIQNIISGIEKILNRKFDELKESNEAFLKEFVHQTQVPVYLSPHEAKDLLGVSYGTLRNRTKEGKINPVKIAGKTFYHKDDIRKLFQEYKIAGKL